MKKEADGVLNDNLNFDDLLEFNRQWIPLTFGALKENGSWYCWGIDEPLMDIYANILKPMIKERQIVFRNLITWDKGNGQGQTSEEFRMYPIAEEKCLFVMCGWDSAQGFAVNKEDYSENMDKVRVYLEEEIAKLGQDDKTIANALGYKSGRTVNHWRSKSQFSLPTRENYEALRAYARTVLGNAEALGEDYDVLKKDYDVLKKDYDERKKEFYEGRAYFDNTHDNMNDVWHFDRTSQEERKDTGGHATPKPIALCARAIKSSSREGEIVLDVFGGSGSTMIACEQLGRRCRMVELDPHYCDVIIARWEKETGRDKRCSDQVDHNQRIADKYQVNSYPTVVFLSSNGTEVGRMTGAKALNAFLDEADKYVPEKDTTVKNPTGFKIGGSIGMGESRLDYPSD